MSTKGLVTMVGAAMLCMVRIAAAESAQAGQPRVAQPAQTAWQQEPAAYRGVPWGTPFDAAVASIEAAVGEKRSERLHYERKSADKSVVREADGTIEATSKIHVGTCIVIETWVFDRDDKLSAVRWQFLSPQFDDLAVTLTEKFGPPRSRQTATLQNRMGATFENTTLTWAGTSVTVSAQRYAGSLNSGAAILGLSSYVAKASEAAAAKQKAAKDVF